MNFSRHQPNRQASLIALVLALFATASTCAFEVPKQAPDPVAESAPKLSPPSQRQMSSDHAPVAKETSGAVEAMVAQIKAGMVTIPAGNGVAQFALSRTEVTQGQWAAVMGSNPSKFNKCGADCPVEQVSWDDVQVFLGQLNAKTGQSYRLPTSQEWEYACLAGQKTEYCGGDSVNAVAWYKGNSASKTHPVQTKQVNGFGLYDMSGNVWEWTSSCIREWACAGRVFRGGSWSEDSSETSASFSQYRTTDVLDDDIGFRLARTAP